MDHTYLCTTCGNVWTYAGAYETACDVCEGDIRRVEPGALEKIRAHFVEEMAAEIRQLRKETETLQSQMVSRRVDMGVLLGYEAIKGDAECLAKNGGGE